MTSRPRMWKWTAFTPTSPQEGSPTVVRSGSPKRSTPSSAWRISWRTSSLNMDPAEFRLKNFINPEQFPYKSVLGWEYDSGNYGAALRKAMEKIGYAALREEQAERRKRGELMGIGISSFTEIVGA